MYYFSHGSLNAIYHIWYVVYTVNFEHIRFINTLFSLDNYLIAMINSIIKHIYHINHYPQLKICPQQQLAALFITLIAFNFSKKSIPNFSI